MNSKKKLRVLVVDDDADFAEGVADTLQLEGHDVAIASTGEGALETFTEFEFDLTFMDVKLPGSNGVESFLEIRRRFPGARVVIMTAFSLDNLLDQAREQGVIGMFHKPLPMSRVLALLEQVQQQARVLVVDRDVDFARELRDMLEMADCSVRSCFDGATALEKGRSESFDVLVVDPALGDIPGEEVCRAMQEIQPGIRILAMSETPEDATVTRLGAPTLRKPFGPGELCALLDIPARGASGAN